jgi:glucosamine-6-phosphate deaminase
VSKAIDSQGIGGVVADRPDGELDTWPVEVVITSTADEAAAVVAGAFEALVQRQPAAVVGLATGSSPLPVYDELTRRHEQGRVSFAAATAFLLDEYVGLPADHPQSYRAVIEREFTARVDFDRRRVHGPDGLAADLLAACAAYEAAISDAGGIDLQLLGVGADGHIGFNEPTSSLASRTRLKTLTGQTRVDNARFFDSIDAVPRHVLTQGVGTILEARHLVLIATGDSKADAVGRTVEGPVSAFFPASALQLHPHATVVVDAAAAVGLRLAEYYRETYAGKPEWQAL